MYQKHQQGGEIPNHPLLGNMAVEELKGAQLLRAQGRTRKATVTGRTVQFKRLNPASHLHIDWVPFWKVHYRNAEEAKAAAEIWEARTEIMERGFMDQA